MAVFLSSNPIGQIGAFAAVQPCCLCVATGLSWTTEGNARLWKALCYAFKESSASTRRKTAFFKRIRFFFTLSLGLFHGASPLRISTLIEPPAPIFLPTASPVGLGALRREDACRDLHPPRLH